jgi:hypothetical protein
MANELAAKKSSPLLIAAAWAVVVLPTAWGLNYTIQNALKIFTRPAATISSGSVQTR